MDRSKNPARAKDDAYVDRIYGQVQEQIQEAVGLLAMKRRFPIIG